MKPIRITAGDPLVIQITKVWTTICIPDESRVNSLISGHDKARADSANPRPDASARRRRTSADVGPPAEGDDTVRGSSGVGTRVTGAPSPGVVVRIVLSTARR